MLRSLGVLYASWRSILRQLCVSAGCIAAVVQHGVAGVQRAGSGAQHKCCYCRWSAQSAAADLSTAAISRALSARLRCCCGGPAALAIEGSGSSAGRPSSAAHRLRCEHRAVLCSAGAAQCTLQSGGQRSAAANARPNLSCATCLCRTRIFCMSFALLAVYSMLMGQAVNAVLHSASADTREDHPMQFTPCCTLTLCDLHIRCRKQLQLLQPQR